jgi:hypothetical protein
MGGPGASVLLRDPLTKRQVDELDLWLQSIGQNMEGDATNVYTFWLKEDALFPDPVSDCLLYLGLHNPTELADEDECRQVREHLGYLPQQEIGVSSGCNQKSDHKTLGLLVLQLAEQYNGLINMGGAITPPLQPVTLGKDFIARQRPLAEKRRAYLRERWDALEATLPPGKTLLDLYKERHSDPDSPFNKISAEMEEKFGPLLPPRVEPSMEEISAFVQGMPGKVYEIYYETARKTLWVYHIVDTTFLREWMNHPHFYMIK